MRLQGYVPLGPGVESRPCKCLLNRVHPSAVAFEIDLRHLPTNHRKTKVSYVFICASQEEANAWLSAVRRQCQPAGSGKTAALGDRI